MPPDTNMLPIILSHVPTWVWVLFAYLIYQGVCALRDHTVPLRRVIILPVAFIFWGLSGLVTRAESSMVPAYVWALFAILLAPAGLLIGPQRIAIDPLRGVVHRRGSPIPLIRNIALFVLQFGIGIAIATHPDHRDALGLVRSAISGAMAGYFAGWGLSFYRRYESLKLNAA